MKLNLIVGVVIAVVVVAGIGGALLLRTPAGPGTTGPQENQPLENQPGGGALTSDFAPPTGKTTGPGEPDPGEHGPWNLRLMSATSTDGLTFTRTDQVSIDQGDVSDLVQDNNGWIYLYYTGWTVGTENNKTVVAISTDGGSTWIYKKLILAGFDGMSEPVDPDIQLLSDGTFRLYLTSGQLGQGAMTYYAEGAMTYYAEGVDGINFTKKGVAFSITDQPVIDPSTLLIGSTWHLFAGGGPPNQSWHATSSDGKTFTFDELKTFTSDGITLGILTNGIPVPGGYRFYAPAPQDNSIRSIFTIDGITWTPDSGSRLTLDVTTGKESWFVKEPAVVRLSNGTYLIVYSTAIP
jgi:hypothetical protein